MNILTKSILTLAALAATGLHAEVFPIAEDTFGTIAKGTILKASGAAKSVTVSAKTKAYVSFDVGNSGIPASSVNSARLTFYVARATKTGTLFLANANAAFSETFSEKSIAMPADSIISTTGLTDASSREFITFDVTNQVKAWLTTPSSEHGFVLAADGTLALTIATKEGAGTGHPAILEVDVTPTIITGGSASFTGGVSSSQFSTDGTNASFSVNTGFSPGAGTTTLVASFLGKNSNGPQLRFSESGSSNFVDIGTDGSDNFVIENKFDAAMLTVTPDGNVGIGTTNPGARLAVSNGTTTLQIRPGELNGTSDASAITLEYPGSGTIGIQDSLAVEQHLSVGGDYYGFGHVFLYAFEGEGADGTAYLQARDNSGTSSIGLQFRTQNAGSIVDIMNLSPLGNVRVGGTNSQFNVNTVGSVNVTTTIQARSAADIALVVQDQSGAANMKVGAFGIECSVGNGFKPGGGSWAVLSDARLKHNVEPLTGALDSLLRLRSVTYEYNDPAATQQPAGKQTGFIAQEVEQVFPEWVGEKADGYKFIGIRGFESLTVQALRELRTEKETEIAALKEKLAASEARRTAAEAEIQTRLARLEAASTSPAPTATTASTQQ